MIFTSVYRHTLDGKRRVPVPFRWRPKDPIDFTLMIFPEPEVGICIRVLPPAQWAKLLQEIKGMSFDSDQKPLLQRLVAWDSIEVRLDSAGRITVPEDMAAAAEITTNVVLAGSLSHFELWNPAQYDLLAKKVKPQQENALKRVRAL